MFVHKFRILAMMLGLGLTLAACVAATDYQGRAGDAGNRAALYQQGGNG